MRANFRLPKEKKLSAQYTMQESNIKATFSITTTPDVSKLATKAELQTETENRIAADEALSNSIPTDTSDLTNGAGFITAAVNDLTNYYLKSETYTKNEVVGLIANIPKFTIEVVKELAPVGEPMTLYLVPKKSEYPDVYEEYLWVDDSKSYELIGSTAVDLSDYYTKSQVDNALSGKQDTLSQGSNISIVNNTISATVPTATSDLLNDSDFITSTDLLTGLSDKADKTNRINGAPLSNTTNVFFGTSSTGASTVQKEVSIPSITNLDVGTVIVVQPSATSTVASSTLKLNNFPAYPMRYNNAAITTSSDSVVWSANYVSAFVFDGTYWQFLCHGLDSNTTYTLNYLADAGQYTAGTGSYAISRYSLIMQKANMTWEKITSTSASYSTATTKTVNTSGFLLGQVKYYSTTTNVAGGASAASSTVYEQSASVDLRYSTNCGASPNFTTGDYIYLVGTIGADGLFYLDSTQWWTNTLPNTNDGKVYMRLGIVLSTVYTASLFEDNPVFYHDGTSIKQYNKASNVDETWLTNFIQTKFGISPVS